MNVQESYCTTSSIGVIVSKLFKFSVLSVYVIGKGLSGVILHVDGSCFHFSSYASDSPTFINVGESDEYEEK